MEPSLLVLSYPRPCFYTVADPYCGEEAHPRTPVGEWIAPAQGLDSLHTGPPEPLPKVRSMHSNTYTTVLRCTNIYGGWGEGGQEN